MNKSEAIKYYLVKLKHESGNPHSNHLVIADTPVEAVAEAIKKNNISAPNKKWVIIDIKLIEIIQEDTTNQE